MGFIRSLFGQKKDKVAEKPELNKEVTLISEASAKQPSESNLSIGSSTNTGRQREHNEDAVLTVKSTHLGDEVSELMGLIILADGMGGHQSGEVASSLAARTVAHQVIRNIYLPYLVKGHDDLPEQPLEQALSEAVDEASKMVYNAVPGGGTTLTCSLIFKDSAVVAHVGDSRAYHYYQGTLRQITKDHSYVDKLVELGKLTEEEAAVHPQKNVLYRAVGQKDLLEVDTYTETIQSGSRLFLCSDGLWGLVSDEQISEVLGNSAMTPQAACETLVAAANAAGGHDNITAIIAEMI